LNLGDDYYVLKEIERWHRALGIASQCLAAHIDIFLQTFREEIGAFPLKECLDCMRVIAPQLLPFDDIYKPELFTTTASIVTSVL